MTVDLPPTLGKVPLKVVSPGRVYCYKLCDPYNMDLGIECYEKYIKLWLFWAEKTYERNVEEHFAFNQGDVDQFLQRLFKRAQEVLTAELSLRHNLIKDQQRIVDRVEDSLRLMVGPDHPTLWDRLEASDANR